MIELRLFGDYPQVDPTLIDRIDVPIILFAAIMLFVAYYKIKNRKFEASREKDLEEFDYKFEMKNYDILMQETKTNSEIPPLINFSEPKMSFKETFFFIGLLIFYYLIFTEKI
ncbi:hypothetical protein MG296_14190 [Flavobacteriaceae bacterium TK19130]|nr:hypothetical protein [Thermobacterium salinum]